MITTDCHVSVPPEVLDELPASFRQWFPRYEERADGIYMLSPEKGADNMGMVGWGQKKLGEDPADPLHLSPAHVLVGGSAEARPSFEPAEVIADLERDGVKGAVLISRVPPWDATRPVEVDIAYCELVNDWNAEHWAPYLDRFAPGICLPARDVDATIEELQRSAAKGLRPAVMPEALVDQPYHSAVWEPFWEVVDDLQMPVTMHVGSRQPSAAAMGGMAAMAGGGMPDAKAMRGFALIGWYQQCWMMGETLGWLTFSGVFERHPNVHVIMTEGYASWLAFAIQFWDHHWDGRFMAQHPVNAMFGSKPTLEAPPGYYLKRQAHATFMWDPQAIALREFTGTDCLLWGNDYPHPEGSFPWSQEWNEKQFAGVPEAEVDAIVRGNAAKLFRIAVD
jgi:predicted TIM-barrel fold metal-dependent hydrolase